MKATLKMLRELKGWNQVTAAKNLKISVNTLSNYEQGKTYPNVVVVKKIEKVYGVKFADIIFLPINYDLTV